MFHRLGTDMLIHEFPRCDTEALVGLGVVRRVFPPLPERTRLSIRNRRKILGPIAHDFRRFLENLADDQPGGEFREDGMAVQLVKDVGCVFSGYVDEDA